MKYSVTKQARTALVRLALVVLPVVAAMPLAPTASAQVVQAGPCGNPFKNHFGPFDFRTAPAGDIQIVEKHHFTPGVESLTQPATTTVESMAGDVGYTLHVFPNHHRALLAMMKLGERHKTDKPPAASFTIDCYFERAIMFRPDDTAARGLYAQYLGKKKRKDEALRQLETALQHAGDNPIANYTIGAIYLDLGEFDRALVQAHKARANGVQWRELEAALRRSGRWKDPQS